MHHRARLVLCAATLLIATASSATPAFGQARAVRNRADVPPALLHIGETTVTRTYTVTTTSDALLATTAPAHTCEDQGDTGQCSYRAAVAAANADFDASPGVTDLIRIPAGTYDLNASVSPNPPVISYAGNLEIEGAGAKTTLIVGSTDSYDGSLISVTGSGVALAIVGVDFEGGASLSGGAVSLNGSDALSVLDCDFQDNTASVSGGAIFAQSTSLVTVSTSTFLDDTAAEDGGAIESESASPLTLSNDHFLDNAATPDSSTADGGAVSSTGPLILQSSTLSQNEAGGAGGAIYAAGTSTLSADVFFGNVAKDAGGGSVFAGGPFTDSTSQYESGFAGANGGAIALTDGGDISEDQFNGNGSAGSGGDIAASGVTQVWLSGFGNSGAEESGGSIDVTAHSALTLVDDTFNGDRTNSSGGSVGGGVIFAGGTTSVSIRGSSILGSSALGSVADGGAIYCSGCELDVDSSEILGNTAPFSGGAIYDADQANVTIVDSTLSGNRSATGGAIESETASTVTITTSSLTSNVAQYFGGGAITMVTGGDLNVSNSTLSGNIASTADGIGGAISVTQTGASVSANLFNDTVVANTANNGGAIYNDGATVAVISSTINDNTATGGSSTGRALDNAAGSVTSSDSIWSSTARPECAVSGGDVVSAGYNLSSDTSCGFDALGDIVSEGAELGPLTSNGGPTETEAPASNSVVLGAGGSACPRLDQRDRDVPTGAPCDIGSVFVMATVTSVDAKAAVLTRHHENEEIFTVTVVPHDQFGAPSGEVEVTEGTTVLCRAVLSPVKGSKPRAAEGSCAPSSNVLGAGVFHVRASYETHAIWASSSSATRAIQVRT